MHLIRLELLADQQDSNWYENRLDFGLDANFDASVRFSNQAGESHVTSLDLAYNYISPITDIVPGISIGVMDAPNVTAKGRRFFTAITFRSSKSDEGSSLNPSEATLGFTAGSHSAGFVGVMLPVSNTFHLLVEHDGWAINSGLELRPADNLAVRWLVMDRRAAVSLQTWKKF